MSDIFRGSPKPQLSSNAKFMLAASFVHQDARGQMSGLIIKLFQQGFMKIRHYFSDYYSFSIVTDAPPYMNDSVFATNGSGFATCLLLSILE